MSPDGHGVDRGAVDGYRLNQAPWRAPIVDHPRFGVRLDAGEAKRRRTLEQDIDATDAGASSTSSWPLFRRSCAGDAVVERAHIRSPTYRTTHAR